MVTMTDYLRITITDFLNLIINNTVSVTGNKPLEKDLFKNIISIQYQALNKTIFIETETFNYVLGETDNGNLRLSEFFKSETMKKQVVF